MHRLLQRPLLRAPRILRARQLMPAFPLGQPFSPVARIALGPLQAPQFHYVAIIVAHGRPPDLRAYCVSLRQSHYRYAAELFFLDLGRRRSLQRVPKEMEKRERGKHGPALRQLGGLEEQGPCEPYCPCGPTNQSEFFGAVPDLPKFSFCESGSGQTARGRIAILSLRGSSFCASTRNPVPAPDRGSILGVSISASFCFAFSRSDARAPQRAGPTFGNSGCYGCNAIPAGGDDAVTRRRQSLPARPPDITASQRHSLFPQ